MAYRRLNPFRAWKKQGCADELNEVIMSLATIRDRYSVPANKGQLVKLFIMSQYVWLEGVIVGSRGLYLRIKMSDGSERLASPTWGIEYVQSDKKNTSDNI